MKTLSSNCFISLLCVLLSVIYIISHQPFLSIIPQNSWLKATLFIKLLVIGNILFLDSIQKILRFFHAAVAGFAHEQLGVGPVLLHTIACIIQDAKLI